MNKRALWGGRGVDDFALSGIDRRYLRLRFKFPSVWTPIYACPSGSRWVAS